MNDFLGLSKDIWEGLFSVAKVLLPGIILALFAIYYQLRKKAEIKLEGAITKLRIKSYEHIQDRFCRIINTVSPTLQDESIIKGIKKFLSYPDLNIDYSECVGSEASFDKFYDEITILQRQENIYLDEVTKKRLERSVALFTHCKLFLDAFCDTERAFSDNHKPETAQKKIDFAYMITAIVLKSNYNGAFLTLEDTMGKQIRNLRLRYSKEIIRRIWGKIREPFLRLLDKHPYNTIAQFLLWLTMPKDYKVMSHALIQLNDVYRYIHIMDRYTPDQYFTMSPEKQLQLTGEFYLALYGNTHR